MVTCMKFFNHDYQLRRVCIGYLVSVFATINDCLVSGGYQCLILLGQKNRKS